eukprot:TRINITY_DN48444_c0_g1_i1.p1 TRINITY_DN48444_c0_g1~~TRINITY_DN48444_c0_g1_i1.p1  ORF type:complete len:264 (+),score=52.28 TRINITY_DN48444_c0_g1_i1:187-978(+)
MVQNQAAINEQQAIFTRLQSEVVDSKAFVTSQASDVKSVAERVLALEQAKRNAFPLTSSRANLDAVRAEVGSSTAASAGGRDRIYYRLREAQPSETDKNKSYWKGWKMAPTELILRQINKLHQDASIPGLVMDWHRVQQPEACEVAVIYKPANGNNSSQMGWLTRNWLDARVVTPVGTDEGALTEYGEPIKLRLEPFRTTYSSNNKKLINRALYCAHGVRFELSLPKKFKKSVGDFNYEKEDLVRGDFQKAEESALWRGEIFA